MWAIVGLGNPGARYKWSRHNIGFQVVDLAADQFGIRFRRNRFVPVFTGKGIIGSQEVVLAKPLTFMNRSGLAVGKLQELFGLVPEKMLVVLDDIDLPWDKLRLRAHGSSGGHKGLQSIISELGTTGFPRLRIGVGRGRASAKGVVQHVLCRFSPEEKRQLKSYCSRALDAIITLLDKGIDVAMNRFN